MGVATRIIGAFVLGALGDILGAVVWVTLFTRNGPIGAALFTGTIALTVGLIGVFQEQIRLALLNVGDRRLADT